MRTIHSLAIAGVATFSAFASLAIPGAAEAGDKFKHRSSITVIIGDSTPGYGYGYGYRSFGRSTGCGWLFDRYEETSSPKWYKRWHQCKYGW